MLNSFYELLETIDVLLFKKKFIEGKRNKKKGKKKGKGEGKKAKKERDKAKKQKKKVKKNEKKAKQRVRKAEKKRNDAEKNLSKAQRDEEKHCSKNESSRKCRSARAKVLAAESNLQKKWDKEIKERENLSHKREKLAIKEEELNEAKEKVRELKEKRQLDKISSSDSAATAVLTRNSGDIAKLKNDLSSLGSSVSNNNKELINQKNITELKLKSLLGQSSQIAAKSGESAGADAGEIAGTLGSEQYIKNEFGKYMNEMADDFVEDSAKEAGIRATKNYLSSGLYIKCSPVQDNSVDNTQSNILLYDDDNINNKIFKNIETPDYGKTIIIIIAMGILIYVVSKFYPAMKGIATLPTSMKNIRRICSIYLLVFSVMCVYIVDSLNILGDYAKKIINIVKKDTMDDITKIKKNIDIKDINNAIKKTGLKEILKGIGLNDRDINNFAKSVYKLIRGDDISFEIEKRYGFFENDTYEKMTIGAFVCFYIVIVCYIYLIYNNWKNISKNALSFLITVFLIFIIVYGIIAMAIYYVWFNVYNKKSISGSANKWKGITSQSQLEKKYVNRLIVSTLFITTVIFDPFLKRMIKSYIKKPTNNSELSTNINNNVELNNNVDINS